MKIRKNHIHLFILLFAVSSLLVHSPPEAFAANGDITAVRAQSLGNNFEYDDVKGINNSLVQVDSDTYALAYRGTGSAGFISTFNISSDGTTITKVHTIEHDTEFAWDNSLIKVDSDTFALAYGGDNGGSGSPAGFISTFTIDSDGTITPIRIQNHAAFASASENLNHDNEGSVNSLVHVNDDTYALSYERNGRFLQITTFTISSDGATITELDTLNQDATNCQNRYLQSLVKVDSDTVARAYCGTSGDGYLRTYSIAENGDITKKSTYEFDTSSGSNHFLVQVDSDTIAVAYQNAEVSGGMVTARNGVIKTFTINSSDEISEADSLEHHSGTNASTGNSEDNSLVKVDSDIFALAYDDGYGGNDGFISTFRIESDGNITGLRTANGGDNLEHDTSLSTNRSLVKVDSNTVALAYGGTGNAGFISTFTIGDADASTSTESKNSGCWDCTRPAITHHGHSETPDGFSINDAIFENNQELYNENPTVEATVGDMVTIKARAWDNRGPENIVRVYTYLDMYEEKPNWHESEAYIEYNIKKDKFEVNDKNNIFALVGASSEVAVNPYHEDGKLNRPLDLLDITFTIIFAKPMEPSHIAIQTIDDAANYELVYFEDALKIKEKVIVEIPEEVIPEMPEEVIPEVPEVIPEPEPPVKEPEPEVIPTALIKKGVLNFVDDDVPAKHYVKRYITETEYREWFDVNYPEYQFWEGIGITQERFDELIMEIESEPKPKMIQTGFVLVPDEQESFPLVKETYEPEPAELEPVKEKKGFFDWLFSLLG